MYFNIYKHNNSGDVNPLTYLMMPFKQKKPITLEKLIYTYTVITKVQDALADIQ